MLISNIIEVFLLLHVNFGEELDLVKKMLVNAVVIISAVGGCHKSQQEV